MATDTMNLPPTWEEFIENFTILDIKEVYTNGSVLVPLFRVKQMMEFYYKPERTCHAISDYIVKADGDEIYWYDGCSECEVRMGEPLPNYCPNCGAKVVDND